MKHFENGKDLGLMLQKIWIDEITDKQMLYFVGDDFDLIIKYALDRGYHVSLICTKCTIKHDNLESFVVSDIPYDSALIGDNVFLENYHGIKTYTVAKVIENVDEELKNVYLLKFKYAKSMNL